MKRLLIPLLIMTILVTGGCSRIANVAEPPKPEVVVDTFIQSLSRGDVNTCLGLLADDVVFHQEPSRINVSGKTQLEAGIRQLSIWHHQYSIVSPIRIEGDRVKVTIKETGDEYKIMGLEYTTGDIEAQVVDGKIKSWTATVNQEDMKKVTELTAGRIGIKFELVKQGMKVKEVAINSPAYEAGIRPGDIITAVNGISYSQMREGEMQLRIQGPVGTRVKLAVTHEGASASLDIEVTRVSPEQLRW